LSHGRRHSLCCGEAEWPPILKATYRLMYSAGGAEKYDDDDEEEEEGGEE